MNEHNAIAIKIDEIQKLWNQKMIEKPKASLICIQLTNADDLPLINGFYKLASSGFSKIYEVPVILFTDFMDEKTFAYQLSKDFLEEYGKALEANPTLPWKEWSIYQDQLKTIGNTEKQEKFLVNLLQSFQQSIPDQKRKFLLGFLPRKVYDYLAFNQWIIQFLPLLGENSGLILTDYKAKNNYKTVLKKAEKALVIPIEDMNIQQAYQQVITAGNPQDPMVEFRKCVMEAGKAVGESNKNKVHHWGKNMMKAAQHSGDKNLWVSSHLIYAGFLFHFKDPQAEELLNKGIRSAKAMLTTNPEMQALLIQLYAYKGSYRSMQGKPTEAVKLFLLAAQTAWENQNFMMTVTQCKNAILAAKKLFFSDEIEQFLKQYFFEFYKQEEDVFKYVEFFYLADYFLRKNKELTQEQKQEIDQRMTRLYGENWRKSAQALAPETSEVTSKEGVNNEVIIN